MIDPFAQDLESGCQVNTGLESLNQYKAASCLKTSLLTHSLCVIVMLCVCCVLSDSLGLKLRVQLMVPRLRSYRRHGAYG